MRNDPAEMASRLARERQAMAARRDAEARATARNLIELNVGPDDRIANVSVSIRLSSKPSRLRAEGETDRSREDVLTLL